MNKPIKRKILKRLKNLSFFEIFSILYIIFSFCFAISNSNDELSKYEEETDVSDSFNVIEDKTEVTINSAVVSPMKLYLSSSSLCTRYDSILFTEMEHETLSNEIIKENTVILEETNTKIVEETTAQAEISTQSEEKFTNEEITNTTEENVKLKFNNFDYAEPVIDNNLSLDEYIYSLIEEYSSYETRIELTYENIYLLARLSIAESEDQCFKGNIAVCEVVLNRCIDRNQTLEQVIFAKSTTGVAQFSCTVSNNPNKSPRIDLTPRKIDALAAVRAILGDMPTNGSYYFVDPALAPNSWAERNREKSIKIDDHQFFY